MATILFAWELGAGLGHLTNLRPLVAGLIERQHQVVMVLRDLSRVRSIIPEPTATLYQAPHRTRSSDPSIEPCTFAQILAHVGFGDRDELAAMVEAWRNIYRAVQPDVIVFDHSPTALLAARGSPARRALLGAGFFCPVDETPLPNLRPWSEPDPAQLARDEALILDRINTVLTASRQPAIERVSQLYHPVDENFLTTFRELDPYPNRTDVRYWGALTDAGGTAADWPGGNGPRVFAYLKPCAALPPLFAALVKLDARVLAYVDGFSEKLRQRFMSPRIRIVDQPLDVRQTVAGCDVAVLNGNHGTVAAMLLAGQPTLQIPIYLDQALVMQAVVRQGCGLGASPTGTDPISQRLEALLREPKFSAAAQQFARRYASLDMRDQIALMVDRIEQLATRPE
jgi:UDP:flavonoid glycosyltransferase YjiC (YdhE family)